MYWNPWNTLKLQNPPSGPHGWLKCTRQDQLSTLKDLNAVKQSAISGRPRKLQARRHGGCPWCFNRIIHPAAPRHLPYKPFHHETPQAATAIRTQNREGARLQMLWWERKPYAWMKVHVLASPEGCSWSPWNRLLHWGASPATSVTAHKIYSLHEWEFYSTLPGKRAGLPACECYTNYCKCLTRRYGVKPLIGAQYQSSTLDTHYSRAADDKIKHISSFQPSHII